MVALRPLRPRRAGGPSHYRLWRTKLARRSTRRDGSQREPFRHTARGASPSTAAASVEKQDSRLDSALTFVVNVLRRISYAEVRNE